MSLLEGGGGLISCDARRGSKDWTAAIEAAGNERLVLKPDVYESVHRMRDVAMKNKDIEYIIEHSKREGFDVLAREIRTRKRTN